MANIIPPKAPPTAPPVASDPAKSAPQVDGSAVHTNPVAERLADLRRQIADLQRIESKTVGGAPVLTPKERMLDARELESKDPDHHYRWIKLQDPTKVQSRIMEGYERVPDTEGGRSLGGDLALFRQPRAKYDERVARQERLTRERENANVHEVTEVVEGVARHLRDRYGIRVDSNRLLFKE